MMRKGTRNGSLAGLCAALAFLGSAVGAHAQEKEKAWSGYVVKGLRGALPPVFTGIKATWKQPSVTCPNPNDNGPAGVSFWVGLDGDQTSTVEQAGTYVICNGPNNTPVYHGFWEMYVPANDGTAPGEVLKPGAFPINPGDTIAASVTYVGDSFRLDLENATTGQKFSVQKSCEANKGCRRATAEWIVEAPSSGNYPLANYGMMQFLGPTVVNAGGAPKAFSIAMVRNAVTLSTCALQPENLPNPIVVNPPDLIMCTWLAAE
jgi:Peptidase A4 family